MNEEYEDLEIEWDLTPEQVAEMEASLQVNNLRYVYFDKQTGDILAKSDRNDLDISEVFFEITSEDLLTAIPQGESVANYKVVTDINNKFEIVPKIITLNSQSTTLIPILRTEEKATVTVYNDIENKNWIVSLDEDERQRLHNAVANYLKQVYVTAEENKNILYRVFDVDLNQLIAKGSIEIPHETVVESITSKIRLFTIRFFDSYALKEKYEPKV